MDLRNVGYWLTTGLFTAALTMSGLLDVSGQMAEPLGQLGYPPYFPIVLGVWKLLGVAALLAPGLPRLKEWAYAGFVFNLTGAVVSHLASGDPASAGVAPAVLLGLMGASWALRPASRVLGQLPTLSSTGTRAAVA